MAAGGRKIRGIVEMKQMLRRWKMVAVSRSRKNEAVPRDVPAGHLPVYVGEERKRFVIETRLLNEPLIRQLLQQSCDEFGYEYPGAITILCSSSFFHSLLLGYSHSSPSTSCSSYAFTAYPHDAVPLLCAAP